MHEQRKNLYHYIIPALLGNISMFILTIVDGMFVGNGVGTDALGAVSLAMSDGIQYFCFHRPYFIALTPSRETTETRISL